MKIKILAQIASNIITKKPDNDIGLFSGQFGEIFFLYYYSLIEKNYKSVADDKLDLFMSNVLTNQNMYHTYCSGVAGVGIGLHILQENRFITLEDDFFEDVDFYLFHKLMIELKNNNIDFLHGAIGLGFYFTKRLSFSDSEICRKALLLLLGYLQNTAIMDSYLQTVKWVEKNEKGKFNISLSHGMSSILIFLCRLYNLNLEKKNDILKMLQFLVNYILNQKQDHKVYGSFFPSLSLEDNPPAKSRLAWCYGDLGVCQALWKANAILKNGNISELIEDILLFSATRTNLLSDFVHDAGLCHGSSGIAQIFYRMFQNTRLAPLSEASQYWEQVTLDFAFKHGDFAEYKKFSFLDDKYVINQNLLEGSTGVGLFLLNQYKDNWDEVLLLN